MRCEEKRSFLCNLLETLKLAQNKSNNETGLELTEGREKSKEMMAGLDREMKRRDPDCLDPLAIHYGSQLRLILGVTSDPLVLLRCSFDNHWRNYFAER